MPNKPKTLIPGSRDPSEICKAAQGKAQSEGHIISTVVCEAVVLYAGHENHPSPSAPVNISRPISSVWHSIDQCCEHWRSCRQACCAHLPDCVAVEFET